MWVWPLTPATSTGPNPQHTGSHLTSSLVGHFPSVDPTSNTAPQISPKHQTVTLHPRQNNSRTKTPLVQKGKKDGRRYNSLFTRTLVYLITEKKTTTLNEAFSSDKIWCVVCRHIIRLEKLMDLISFERFIPHMYQAQ